MLVLCLVQRVAGWGGGREVADSRHSCITRCVLCLQEDNFDEALKAAFHAWTPPSIRECVTDDACYVCVTCLMPHLLLFSSLSLLLA